jgi:hypothetical protein
MHLISAEVAFYNSTSGHGVARYTDDMHNVQSVHIFGKNYSQLKDDESSWIASDLPLFLDNSMSIFFSEMEHGIAKNWTIDVIGERQRLDARSTYYTIYCGDTSIWDGALTTLNEIHSNHQKLPVKLEGDMAIHQIVRSENPDYPDHAVELSWDEAVVVWTRMLNAKWVKSPFKKSSRLPA